MNKLIKATIIAGSICAACDVSFLFGKGCMLGTMAKYNVTSQQVIEILSKDKNSRIKFVRKIAELKMES